MGEAGGECGVVLLMLCTYCIVGMIVWSDLMVNHMLCGPGSLLVCAVGLVVTIETDTPARWSSKAGRVLHTLIYE